jgi:hypothetical protein
MANVMARLAVRGLRFLEDKCANVVAGKVTCTWPAPPDARAASFPCTASMLERGVTIAIGGNPVTIALVLYLRRDLFHTADSLWSSAAASAGDAAPDDWTAADPVPLPIAGKFIEYKGVKYKIVLVADSHEQSHLKVTLADQHSGR